MTLAVVDGLLGGCTALLVGWACRVRRREWLRRRTDRPHASWWDVAD